MDTLTLTLTLNPHPNPNPNQVTMTWMLYELAKDMALQVSKCIHY